MSKRVFQENKACQIFRTTNILYSLIRTMIKILEVITLKNILVSVNRKISLATCSYAAKIRIQKKALKVTFYNLT